MEGVVAVGEEHLGRTADECGVAMTGLPGDAVLVTPPGLWKLGSCYFVTAPPTTTLYAAPPAGLSKFVRTLYTLPPRPVPWRIAARQAEEDAARKAGVAAGAAHWDLTRDDEEDFDPPPSPVNFMPGFTPGSDTD